jgi:hypothetical protein
MQARTSPQKLTVLITSCESLEDLGGLLQEEWGLLNDINAAAAFAAACDFAASRQGRLSPVEEEVMALELYDEHLGRMGGRELSSAFYAMVNAGYEPANSLRGRVLAALLADDGARLRDNSMQGTSNVLLALATLHQHGKEQINQAGVAVLVGVASGKLRDPGTAPQALSNVAWALAVLGHEDRAFMGELLAAAQEQLPAFEPQGLSNTAWALAKLGLHVDSGDTRSLVELQGQPPNAQSGRPKAQLQRFLDALADEAAGRLGPGLPSAAKWSSQHLANTIWAFSELRHFHNGLWGAVTGEALARCGRYKDSGWKGQEVSNLALGLARRRASEGGAPDPALVQLLQQQGSWLAAERPQAFSTQGACNLAWAHAAAGAPYCAWLMEGLVLPLSGIGDLNREGKSQLLKYFEAMERPGSGMPPAVAQRPGYQRLRQLCKGP